jgi:hypothetical protein
VRAGEPTRSSNGPERGGRLELRALPANSPAWLVAALDVEAKLVTVRIRSDVSETQVLGHLLKGAAEAHPHGGGDAQQRSLAFAASTLVVAPHHSQIADLQLLLRHDQPTLANELRVETVEKMQGQEADLVFICYGLLDPSPGEAGFLYNQARLNVTVTRARKKCVLLVSDCMEHPDTWCGSAAQTPDVQDGIAYLRRAVRVCRQGSAAADARRVVDEPARGSRYVDVEPASLLHPAPPRPDEDDDITMDGFGPGGGSQPDADSPPPPPPPPAQRRSSPVMVPIPSWSPAAALPPSAAAGGLPAGAPVAPLGPGVVNEGSIFKTFRGIKVSDYPEDFIVRCRAALLARRAGPTQFNKTEFMLWVKQQADVFFAADGHLTQLYNHLAGEARRS